MQRLPSLSNMYNHNYLLYINELLDIHNYFLTQNILHNIDTAPLDNNTDFIGRWEQLYITDTAIKETLAW